MSIIIFLFIFSKIIIYFKIKELANIILITLIIFFVVENKVTLTDYYWDGKFFFDSYQIKFKNPLNLNFRT